MDEPWDCEFVSRLLDGLVSFLSEFAEDWLANDMRAAVFKILLAWVVLSLVAIHFAWKVYGHTVNDMYYRQGTGGQNGGTPETTPHLSG
ncbi:T-cell leukemia translocation-altered gene protein homolog isoform X2 [Amia ocellicauda]